MTSSVRWEDYEFKAPSNHIGKSLIGHLHCCIGVVVSLASLSSFWCQCCALLDLSTSFLSSYVDTLCSSTLQQMYMVYFCLIVSSLPCSMYFFLFNLCSPNFVVQCFWLEVLWKNQELDAKSKIFPIFLNAQFLCT
jgi:hypothetical protein